MITLLSTKDPFVDLTCNHLAVFLREWLNEAYVDQVVVRSIRSYNAYNVPYGDYPLLKVFRLSNQGTLNHTISTSQLAIAYCLVMPDLEILAPLLDWVREEIVKALTAFSFDHTGCCPKIANNYQADYLNMFNQVTRQVEMFLRITISIQEF